MGSTLLRQLHPPHSILLLFSVLSFTPADATRINIKSVNEINYWCHTFRCNETLLRNAVLAVGFLVADVQIYLNR
jgi:hypothetical protein